LGAILVIFAIFVVDIFGVPIRSGGRKIDE